jgi:hypothetical protein
MNSPLVARPNGGNRNRSPENRADHVVELGLLLPADRAADLIRLAKDRQESVGHLLRKLIDRELATSA